MVKNQYKVVDGRKTITEPKTNVYTKVITVISSNASLLGSGQDTDNLLDQTVNAMMVSNYAPTGAPDGSLESP